MKGRDPLSEQEKEKIIGQLEELKEGQLEVLAETFESVDYEYLEKTLASDEEDKQKGIKDADKVIEEAEDAIDGYKATIKNINTALKKLPEAPKETK